MDKGWLTTGEMIDRLKVGEVAEDDTGFKVAFGIAGCLRVYSPGTKVNGEGTKYIVGHTDKKIKWRILPKYVSFEEAMKALKEGKMINFHHENSRINAHKELHPVWFKNYQWNDLLEGKWTIEE